MDRKIRQRIARLESRLATAQPKTPPPKGKSRKGRQLRRAQITGTNGGPAGFQNLPVARSFTSGRSSYFSVQQRPPHPDLGQCVRVSGQEVALNVVTAAAGADLFTSSVASATNTNTLQVSPDAFNGRLALTARTYAKYVFRSLRIHFVPALGTANPGLAAIGYSADGANPSYATQTFAAATQMTPSIVFSLNAPTTIDVIRNPTGTNTYFTELDAGDFASLRQTIQGVVIGFPSSNALGVLTQGVLWVEYVVDLYGPSNDYGFTITAQNKEEQALLVAFRNRERSKARAAASVDDDFDDLSISSKRSRPHTGH